jgi:hypothetical protein
VADAVAGAGVVLVAVPGPAVTDMLTAAGRLDGRIVIDAANMMGPNRLSLRQLADAFPAARWVRVPGGFSADDGQDLPGAARGTRTGLAALARTGGNVLATFSG